MKFKFSYVAIAGFLAFAYYGSRTGNFGADKAVDHAFTKIESGLQSTLNAANSEYAAAATRKANRGKILACVNLRNSFVLDSKNLDKNVAYDVCDHDLKKLGIEISDYDKDGVKWR